MEMAGRITFTRKCLLKARSPTGQLHSGTCECLRSGDENGNNPWIWRAGEGNSLQGVENKGHNAQLGPTLAEDQVVVVE